MRVRSLHLLVLLALAAAAPAARAEPVAVTATPIPLDEATPSHTTVGAFHYLGGLDLTSPDHRFGGFSALGISADGKRMVSISDRGSFLSANLKYGADGALTGIANVDMSSLTDPDGRPLTDKQWSDAEAMSPGVNGEIIVSFEREHRFWRYDPGDVAAKILRSPAELAKLPANHGVEALTLLDDGRLLAIAEGDPKESETIAWVSRPDGWDVMTYRTDGGYRPSGAATMPGGDVLVLERYHTPRYGVRTRIKRLDPKTVQAGAELTARLIVDLNPPLSVDNFEGIEARRSPDGRTLVYLISDNNFSDTQRTLLLMFAYDG